MTLEERLFAGKYPCGIVFADRGREKGGDYARLAFMSYTTLKLEIEPDCPRKMRSVVEAAAASMNLKAGQRYQIAGNLTITLGE